MGRANGGQQMEHLTVSPPPIVAPAKAGAHNHRPRFLRKTSANRTCFSNSPRDAPEGMQRPSARRAWGMPGAQCTRSLVCAWCSEDAHEYSQRSHRKSPGIPARNGFNGFLRALPGDRAFLSPSLPDQRLIAPGWADLPSDNLTPASRRQDHTTSPSATGSVVRVPSDRSRIVRPALHHVPRPTLPRPPHPAPRSVTTRTPLGWDETGWLIAAAGISENQNIFSYGDGQPKSHQI
jgi:hypothetical protein